MGHLFVFQLMMITEIERLTILICMVISLILHYSSLFIPKIVPIWFEIFIWFKLATFSLLLTSTFASIKNMNREIVKFPRVKRNVRDSPCFIRKINAFQNKCIDCRWCVVSPTFSTINACKIKILNQALPFTKWFGANVSDRS